MDAYLSDNVGGSGSADVCDSGFVNLIYDGVDYVIVRIVLM